MMKTVARGLAFLFLLAVLCASARADAPVRRPTIVFVSGEFEYKSAETLPAFARQVEATHGFKCIYLERKGGAGTNDIPGLEALDRANLLVVFIRRMTLPDAQLSQFKKYAESGRPIIGIRTASHAFENWKEWDRDVLGGNYQNHHNNKLTTTVRVVPEAAGHAILAGVAGEFTSAGSLYRNSPLPAGSTPLLMGSIEGKPPEPVAWTHAYKNSKVFYTSLGHPQDFASEPFRKLLVNAMFWSLQAAPVPGLLQPLDAPAKRTAAPPPAVPPAGIRRVGVAEFEQLWQEKKHTVLDVRTEDEFNTGHIPGAVNLDVLDAGFEKKLAALDKSKTYLVHCAAGRRSATAADQMKALGFKSVIDLAPGFNGWKAANKPVEK